MLEHSSELVVSDLLRRERDRLRTMTAVHTLSALGQG